MTNNPKHNIGAQKAPLSYVPPVVMHLMGVGMAEGAMKYGPFNWRESKVENRIYYDATIRHLNAWWEGEDIDPDSDLPHPVKAMCSLAVLVDAMYNDMMIDNRPKAAKANWMQDMNNRTKLLLEKMNGTRKDKKLDPKAYL